MSQKNAKRLRRLESRMNIAEAILECHDSRLDHATKWAAAEEKTRQEARESDAARVARRQEVRVREAEYAARQWKTVAYSALVAAILVLIVAITAVSARATEESAPAGESATAPISQIIPVLEPSEDFENEKIEAALLARATVIEDCTITHYDTCVECCGKADGITASGVRATPGVTVAVDPTVIPLGSDVLVDYGDGTLHYMRADDTGVKGNHIDICVSEHQEADQLGRRTATVYWVAPEGR